MRAGQAGALGFVFVVLAALALAKSSTGEAGQTSATADARKSTSGDAGEAAIPDGGTGAQEDPCPPALAEAANRLIKGYEDLYPRLAMSAPEAGDAGDATARRFHHVIGLVPDPIATERSDAFDSALEGLEEAVARGMPVDGGVQAVSYVRDHFWLPWSGSDDRKAKRCWMRHPGVILYRPAGDPRTHPAFLVLLVGETPTVGVRKDQLEAAIRLVVRHQALEDSDAGPELRIVGPTFSGTAPSLAAVLRDRLDAGAETAWPSHVSMVSGTATNPGVGALLEDLGDAGTTATYATTTPSDKELLAAMWAFLEARGAQGPHDDVPGNAVVLSESVTAYGEGVEAQSDGGCGPSSPCFAEREFPLDLTSLREAEGEGDAGAPAPRTHVAELSEDTPYVHGLELAKVLRELSRDETRFVGLVATDPRDVLFLAQRIRDVLPDVRLFTLASDIRYLDSSHAQALDGMLVAHAAEDGAQRTPSIALANETVRSIYLATRRILGEGRDEPRVEISLIGHGGLWQVGPYTGVPGGPRDPSHMHRPLSWRFVYAFMWILFAIVLGAVVSPWVADRLNSCKRISDLKTTGFLRHRGSLWAHIGRCAHLDLRADDGLVTAAMLVIAMCPPLLMLGSTWTGAVLAPFPLVAVVAASLVVAAWVQARCHVGVASRARAESAQSGAREAEGAAARQAPPGTNWSAIIISVAAATAGLVGLTMAFGPPRETTYNLLSGASPVLAVIVGLVTMGIGLWCWRVRLRFLDTHRFGMSKNPKLALSGETTSTQEATSDRGLFADIVPPIAQALGEVASNAKDTSGIDEIERRLLRVIRTPWTTFTVIPVAIHLLFAATVAVPLVIKPPQTLEPGLSGDVLAVFGILAFLPITGNFSRLLATWILIRRLLRRLASHPCVRALEGLPPSLSRNLTAQLAVSGGDMSDLTFALRSFERLAEIDPARYSADYEICRTALAKELRCAAGADGTSIPEAEKKAGEGGETEDPSSAGAVADGLLAAAGRASKDRKGANPKTRAAIDDLSATLLAVFVPRYVRHVRLFMPPLIVGIVLSVAMTSLYFIQPERLITSLIFVWVAAIVLSGFVVYADLDRDPVVSAIGKTTAGSVHLDWGFVTRTVSWGLLPLVSLVASQYPALGSVVSGLFDSLAKGFR